MVRRRKSRAEERVLIVQNVERHSQVEVSAPTAPGRGSSHRIRRCKAGGNRGRRRDVGAAVHEEGALPLCSRKQVNEQL